MAKTFLANVADVPAGKMKHVVLSPSQMVLVANISGTIYAMKGSCNHKGGPLGLGKLDGKIVSCPLHGSQWDVTTGKLVKFSEQLPDEPIYKVAVEEGKIYAEI